jgi:hypothetical protein
MMMEIFEVIFQIYCIVLILVGLVLMLGLLVASVLGVWAGLTEMRRKLYKER